MKVFIFGLGYSASVAARIFQQGGAVVAGTTRSAQKQAALQAAGIDAILFDGEGLSPALCSALHSATHVLQSIGPSGDGDPVVDQLTVASLPNVTWLGYYSTVGVYGNFDGGWVDETAVCAPVNARSIARLAAEAAWRRFASDRNLPLTIFRLAGIYGPGRSTFDKLRRGTSRRIIKSGQVFNRIHVEDIAAITYAAAQCRLSGIFNIADDEPAPPQDVITFAADLLGMAPPPAQTFEQAEMSPMARSFYSDNKRVSNAAIKRALDYQLLHPTFRQGLPAILAAGSDSTD